MNQKELIDYWCTSAAHDLNAMDNLFSTGNYDWALFIAHIVIEKVLKARWVFDHGSAVPPKTHGLDKLARETMHPFLPEQLAWIVQANDFNIEARYPDYKMQFYRRATKEFATENIKKARDIYQCILNTLR
jgi:HEPN domain-containing protein